MSGGSYIAPPRSWDSIGTSADRVRGLLGLSEQVYFPVMPVLEGVLDRFVSGFTFLVGDHEEMGSAEGFTCPEGSFIMLRDDVYTAACHGNARARFTAAHELGHLVLHTRVNLMPRTNPNQKIEAYRLTEPQANQFAAEILMPRCFIQYNDDANSLVERFGVSFEAALNRVNYLQGKGLIRR